ncbi:MAG: hypothetical protein OXE97_02540 [Gammaproteobacteria bacterium]|nr:hypothetical protein [Gammaproteobacteria bacterium]MCY4305710.1 hypothetical protein [Aestuariivita sp.]
MFLARKITRAKWESQHELSADEIPADAITSDLRTRGNSLSFWQCGIAERGQLDEAVLAIAAGRDSVEKVEIIWLAEDELEADGQTLKNTEGRTPVTGLSRSHVDVCGLDYVRLGKIAHGIVRALKEERHLKLSKIRVRKLLTSAVGQRRIDVNDLGDKVRAEIMQSLQSGNGRS